MKVIKSERAKNPAFRCLGCLVIAAGSLIVLCAVMCGTGYYVVMHSSFPLAIVESALELSGEVDVQGLSGSISSGFHADSIAFSEDGTGNLSTLDTVEFQIDGFWTVAVGRLLIKEISVASGTIYFSPDASERPDEIDGNHGGDSDETGNQEDGVQEVRIDLIQFTDLKFINSVSGAESKLGKFSMKDFHYVDGEVSNMGEYELVGFTFIDDEFELRNLSGTPEDGFQLDRFRIKDKQGNWSQIEKPKFEFNGIKDLYEQKRLVIDDISIESGTFYINWDELSSEGKPSDSQADDVAKKDSLQLKEFAVKNFRLPNMKFIHPSTGSEFKIQEISFSDLQFLDNKLTKLGDVLVSADHLEFHYEASPLFKDQPADVLKRRFSGSIGANFHENLKQDIAFEVDCCFPEVGTIWQAKVFDSKLQAQVDSGRTEVTFTEFNPSAYFQGDVGLLPTNINGRATAQPIAEEKDLTQIILDSEFNLRLGKLLFRLEETSYRFQKDAKTSPGITFKNAEQEIVCKLFLTDSECVFDLQQGTQRNTKALFAKVFFSDRYSNLSKANQSLIDKQLKPRRALKSPKARAE